LAGRTVAQAQSDDRLFKLGVHTGNHFTLWGEGVNEDFRRQALLRYSIGLTGRSILLQNWRTDFFILPVR
ncbi:MAG: hypothetical protein AAFO94_13280, partial [Bacteroidota bacterium]